MCVCVTSNTTHVRSRLRTPDTRALPAPGLRRADSGADHFASCLAFSHAMRFTLSRLSLSTARAARYHTRTHMHANCTHYVLMLSCSGCRVTCRHTLCVSCLSSCPPPLLRYLKCMHTLYVRVPPLFVSQMYMLTYKRTEHRGDRIVQRTEGGATELYDTEGTLLACRRSQVRAMQVLSFPALFS